MSLRTFVSSMSQRFGDSVPALRWIELVANIAVIATIIVMWVIYTAERDDAEVIRQKEMSVAMLTLGYDENIVAAEREAVRFIIASTELFEQAYLERENGKAFDVPMPDTTKDAFLTLTDYYDDVLACRESGGCDTLLIDTWFKDDICNFTEFAELGAFPKLIDDFGPRIGDRLSAYSKGHCEAD